MAMNSAPQTAQSKSGGKRFLSEEGGAEVATRQDRINLHTCLADMMAFEDGIQKQLRSWGIKVSAHPGVNTTVSRLHTMVQRQREALRARLQAVDGSKLSAKSRPSRDGLTVRVPAHRGANPVSAAIHEIFTACTHAAFGYTKLHAIAHRFFDRTTADLAEQHMRAHLTIARDLNWLISDVVVWELTSRGQECQCHCPSCGVGICVCAPHGTATVEEAWRELPIVAAQPGMLVQPPRAHSAARASLRAGDIVVAVDDQEILSVDDIQNAIRKHNPGEQIRLRIQRDSDKSLEVVITRPQPPS